MANRHLLAVNKLDNFKQWLINNEWEIEEPKGKYEVLRARKCSEKNPLIVYKKTNENLVHLSVSDYNARFVEEFIESQKKSMTEEKQLLLNFINYYETERDNNISLKRIEIANNIQNKINKLNNIIKFIEQHE